jgi:hypothetical protein
MSAGEVCTYSLRTPCGAPGFKVREDTNAPTSRSTILYTEADQARLAASLSGAADYQVSDSSSVRPNRNPPGSKAAMVIAYAQAGDSTKIDG